MKINKYLMAGVLGLSLAGVSKADEIYVAGSSAARAAFFTACTNPGVVFQSAPVVYSVGAPASGAQYMAFQGTLVGGSGSTVINCNFAGSEAGIVAVAKIPAVETAFIDNANFTGTPNTGIASATATHIADMAMADNVQDDSPTGASTVTGMAALTGKLVGIVPFYWVRNNGSYTGNNITSSQIRQALAGGAKLAVFTGNPADVNNYVYVAGRASSSGTRVNAFGDSGFGAATSPKQIELDTNSATAGNMLSSTYKVGTKTLTRYSGDWGRGAADIALVFGANTTTLADKVNTGKTGYGALAYLGVSDEATAVGNGAVALTYNGVPFSLNNITEGTYTFWGNEYLYLNPTTGYTDHGSETTLNATQSPNVVAAYNLLSATTGISAQADNYSVFSTTLMHAVRSSAGGDVSHN